MRTSDIVDYFTQLRERMRGHHPTLSDYIYPPEFTAEALADKFKTTKAAIFMRLKKMEEDNLVVSRRAYVEGKPGKRLVFFLKDETIHKGTERANGDAGFHGRCGMRDILVEYWFKDSEIQNLYDCVYTHTFHIRNMTKNNLNEIITPMTGYGVTKEGKEQDELLSLEVAGKTYEYGLEGVKYYKKSSVKWSIEDSEGHHPHTHFMRYIMHQIPLEQPLKPGEVVKISYKELIKSVYPGIFHIESQGVTIREHTFKVTQRIKPQAGYLIKQVKRYKATSYPYGIYIEDKMDEMRKPEVEKSVAKPYYDKDVLVWDIERPVIGYLYSVPFVMVKKTAK